MKSAPTPGGKGWGQHHSHQDNQYRDHRDQQCYKQGSRGLVKGGKAGGDGDVQRGGR